MTEEENGLFCFCGCSEICCLIGPGWKGGDHEPLDTIYFEFGIIPIAMNRNRRKLELYFCWLFFLLPMSIFLSFLSSEIVNWRMLKVVLASPLVNVCLVLNTQNTDHKIVLCLLLVYFWVDSMMNGETQNVQKRKKEMYFSFSFFCSLFFVSSARCCQNLVTHKTGYFEIL